MNDPTNIADAVNQIGMVLIPVLVPLTIGVFKKYVWPNVPGPLLPVAAALLGPIFDLALVHLANIPSTGLASVALGLAGVGLREMKEGTLRGIGVPKVQANWLACLAAGALTVLLLAGCAADPEVRWAQGQKAYNTTMATLKDYREPCVPSAIYPSGGPDNPYCRIDDDAYRSIETVRARVDQLLTKSLEYVDAGDEILAEFYLDQLDAALLELAVIRANAAKEKN